MIQPYADRVLIQRIEEWQGIITLTDAPRGFKGRVLAVGPGKKATGDWYHVGGTWETDANGIQQKVGGEWEWIERESGLEAPKVGSIVYFNSKWHDLGDDYQQHAYWDNPNLHLVQFADVVGRVNA